MNICLVGLNNNNAKRFAVKLSAELGYGFVDLKKEFDKFLLKTAPYPLILADEMLKKAEKNIIKNSLENKNVVVYLPNDMFLSNQNYKLVGCVKVAILENLSSGIKFNLQNLIVKNCTLSISSQASIKELRQKIAENQN